MKKIVIYTSQTGFTKRYAEWISEASGAECVEFKQAKKSNFLIMMQLYSVAGAWLGELQNLAGLKIILQNFLLRVKRLWFIWWVQALQKVLIFLLQ